MIWATLWTTCLWRLGCSEKNQCSLTPFLGLRWSKRPCPDWGCPATTNRCLRRVKRRRWRSRRQGLVGPCRVQPCGKCTQIQRRKSGSCMCLGLPKRLPSKCETRAKASRWSSECPCVGTVHAVGRRGPRNGIGTSFGFANGRTSRGFIGDGRPRAVGFAVRLVWPQGR